MSTVRGPATLARPAGPPRPAAATPPVRPAARGHAGLFAVLALLGLGYAGYVKGLPLLAGLAVDLTGLFAVLVGLLVAVRLVRRRVATRALLVVGALWLTFLLGAASGVWVPGGPYKVALLLTVTLLCAAAPAALLTTAQSRRWLVVAMVGAGLAMAAALLASPDREAEALYGRLTLEGSNSIGTARVVGAGAAAALVRGLSGRGRRGLWLACAAAMAAVLVLVGSRGPFVGLVVAVVVVVLVGRNAGGLRRLWVGGIGLLAVLALLLVVTRSDNRAAGRIAGLLTGAQADEVRLTLVQQSLVGIAHHPLGIGWGAFPTVLLRGALWGRYPYPHNMVVEVVLEGGWLAGLAFLAVVVVALRGFWRHSASATGATLFAVGVYWLTVAQSSGDVNANRMTWIMIGLGLVLQLARGDEPGAVPLGDGAVAASAAQRPDAPHGRAQQQREVHDEGDRHRDRGPGGPGGQRAGEQP